jgi:hypothetical protein
MKTISIALLSIAIPQLAHAADQEQKAKFFEQFFEQHRNPAMSEQERQQQIVQQNPIAQQCAQIWTAFMRSEACLYDKAAMQARIAKERAEWNEQQRRVLTDIMRYFSVPIRKIFREDSQDQLAQLAINTIKEYEKQQGTRGCVVSAYGVTFYWAQNEDNTRLLECTVNAKPEALMAMYNSSQNE